MIVPMKKVTLVALAEEETSALNALRDLGVMQLCPGETRSAATQSAAERAASAHRYLTILQREVGDETPKRKESSASGEKVLARVAEISAENEALSGEIDTLARRIERLAPWGKFSRHALDELAQKGVEVILCSGSIDDCHAARELPGVCIEMVWQTGKQCGFAAIKTDASADVSMLPQFRLAADDDPADLAKRKNKTEKQLAANGAELKELSRELAAAESYCDALDESAEFERANDALTEKGAVAALCGFVPEPEIAALRQAAKKNGWGVLISDPGEDEAVPVLVKYGRFSRIVKPLFDFLGIVPGYREMDVSAGVLIFFTIFYAIIIGDAGYGLIFTILALLGLRASRKKPMLKLPMGLFLILSVATVIWGTLCGSWFGMEFIPFTHAKFWGVKALQDFATDTVKQANIQLFCFILAVIQLSTGRIWKALHERRWRAFGEHFGWTLVIWGNFCLTLRIIVAPGDFPTAMYYFYGAGLALIVSCGVNWRSVADVFQLPFSVLGSFTDVLSYIRLFAVGMAGASIAASFNSMAFSVCQASAWFLPAGIIVVLAGHALNIALAFLSVLVHAVRLNTLEFSNHAGLTWSGQNFNPFKKTTKP